MTDLKAILPKHIAIIMDGNGRWAKERGLPRVSGHSKGVESVRRVIEACQKRSVRYLTLFAFSSENWQRPAYEVKFLMDLFVRVLQREIMRLHQQQVRVRFIGDIERFNDQLRDWIKKSEEITQDNNGLQLVVALNYGGRWDIVQACRKLAEDAADGRIKPEAIDALMLSEQLSTREIPDPDLLIRTSGESRLSNFLLWQMAYSELYFSPSYWPDFNEDELDSALQFYASRERRFGGVNEVAVPDDAVEMN